MRWSKLRQVGDAQARALREYLLRGGFFMCDDFHGAIEWDVFAASMRKVFPDRQIVDISPSDPIFHTLYDLEQRYQVPGALFLETGLTYEKGETGKVPHWRGIYDDNGRLMAVMCHNMDLGDSWPSQNQTGQCPQLCPPIAALPRGNAQLSGAQQFSAATPSY